MYLNKNNIWKKKKNWVQLVINTSRVFYWYLHISFKLIFLG